MTIHFEKTLFKLKFINSLKEKKEFQLLKGKVAKKMLKFSLK